jgi:malonate decarboxylase delta subunit
MSCVPARIETLQFDFAGREPVGDFPPVLVGVVGSGNLEVLLEPRPGTGCRFHIQTSARGFAEIWLAVVSDFHARYPLAGAEVSIHDMGATPAVVSLRLAQAIAELPGART